jgi:hypothetical protein
MDCSCSVSVINNSIWNKFRSDCLKFLEKSELEITQRDPLRTAHDKAAAWRGETVSEARIVSGALAMLLVEICPSVSWAALLKTAGGKGAIHVHLQLDDGLHLQ